MFSIVISTVVMDFSSSLSLSDVVQSTLKQCRASPSIITVYNKLVLDNDSVKWHCT